jgi:hypothetical protein
MALTDQSPMPFGTHIGKPMEKVPASYLLWLWDEPDGLWQPSRRHEPVRQYIIDRFNHLETECTDRIINHRLEGK